MRRLEIIDPLLLTLYLVWPHPRPLAVRLLPSAALILTLAHFKLEGFRWQMIPLHLLNSLMVAGSLYKIGVAGDWPSGASLIALILVALATALPILLPVPQYPKPAGRYPVGTTLHEFVDRGRQEIYSSSNEPRRIMAQVWYPAKVTSADAPAAWMPHAKVFTRAIARYIHFPYFFLDHLALIKMPAYQDAAISDQAEKFPVIVFSHGWNGFNTQNTSQAIELASHGYMVISIQHTYGAVMTVFSDGTIAPGNPKTLPQDENDAEYELVARKLVDQWVGDIGFVLDRFEALNKTAGDSHYEKLDFARIGVYGHSTGSGAAIQFCARDPRGKAVLGMDPFMRPVAADVIAGGISQPSFFMFSQLWADVLESRNNVLFRKLRSNSHHNKGVIRISGTRHYDFSDVPLLSPIGAQLGLRGALNGRRATQIVTAYLVEFFEMTLNDRPSILLESSPPPFPEVRDLIA